MIKLTPAFIFLIGFLAFPVFAQPDRAPVLSKNVQVEYPEIAFAEGLRGVVVTQLTINKNGKVTKVEYLGASHPVFVEPALVAVREMEFLPAIKNGKAVEAIAKLPIVFVPKGQISPSIMPLYHPDVKKAGIKGTVVVKIDLDWNGQVSKIKILKSSGSLFSKAAEKAVNDMKFEPPRIGKIRVSNTMTMAFGYVLTNNLNPDRPVTMIKHTSAIYPRRARERGIEGNVNVQITSDKNGKVTNVKILSSSHPLLSGAALEAARKMEFKPAIKNGEPVGSSMKQPFGFNLYD